MLPCQLRDRCLAITISISLLLVPSAAVSANERGSHLVTEVKGNVLLRRGWLNLWKQSARVGDAVGGGDELQLSANSAAKVLCRNGVVWNPRTAGKFRVSEGCREGGRPILVRQDSDRIPARTLSVVNVPYIISPRNTSILESQPLLHWNPVAGSKGYRVSVTGPGVKWERQVSQSQVRYDGSEVFKPGMRYRVVVEAENGASSESDGVTGFSRLDDNTAKQFQADLTALQQQPFAEEGKVLAIAHLERSNDLYARAIERLEQWLGQGNSSAAGYQLLGALYEQVGLLGLARERYVTGLELMRRDRHLEGQAEIANRLGQIDQGVGRLKDAIAWLEEARLRYGELGDQARVQQIEKDLADLREKV